MINDGARWSLEQYKLRTEEWRPISGYDGLYEVSSHGRVKSLKYKKEVILKPRAKVQGKEYKQVYYHVILYNGCKRKDFYVHTLVANAFLSNPENKPCIDHIYGTDGGNAVWNLRWCTKAENNNFLLSRKHNSNAHKPRPVKQYTKDGQYIKTFRCAREASDHTGIARSSITRCCCGKLKLAGGYIWKYSDNNE